MTVQGRRRKVKAPLCLVKDRQGEGHIAYHDDICPIEARNYLLVMTLLSPAPSERLRRMRPQGVLPPCAKKREKKPERNSRWYSLDISSQPNTPCIALPPCTPRDEEALQTCLATVQGERVVFVQHCVHYLA